MLICGMYFISIDVIISGPVTVDVGNELFVTCNVSTAGYNQDLFSIEWFIDSNVVDTGDDRFNITKEISDYYMQSTLTIKHVTKKNRAEYLCRTTSKQVGRQHIFVLESGKCRYNAAFIAKLMSHDLQTSGKTAYFCTRQWYV